MLDETKDMMISKLTANVNAGLLWCKNDEHSTILY